MSKGDKQRPMAVSYGDYVDKWEKAFGKKCNKSHVPNEKTLKAMEMTEGLIEYETVEELIGACKEKSSVTLLNDVSLDAQIERMKTGHA